MRRSAEPERSRLTLCTDSSYLNLLRCSARTLGSFRIRMPFSASWRPEQVSQKNLLRERSISLALNCRRHEVRDELRSMSIERSRNDSSREVTFAGRVD